MPWKKGSSYIITPLGAKNIAGPWLSLVIIIWKKRKGALELPNFLRPGCQQCKLRDPAINKFMGKRFQAAQLTHERFLTIGHSCKIFFWYLPNWTSTDLCCVVLYVTYSTAHQRSMEVQFGRYQKHCRSDLWSKISHVLVVQLETFSP